MPDGMGQRLRTESNGAYQVYELVAAGAFGSVYFGRDLGTNRAVAIKKLHPHWARDPRAVERFNEEGSTGRELQHPNVVQLVDQGIDDDGVPFIVMQWVEGWTVAALLQRYVQQRGAFPIEEAVEIAWQALAGLEAARRIGLVHRDIKPLNLMVTPERLVKVMDFGIAKNVLAAVTGDNTQVGTLAYMAPEQFTGAAVDTRTDVYALGITLYELLAGQKPFLGPTPAAFVRQHLYETPQPLAQLRPEVEAGLAEVVQRALARQPEDRFQLPTQMQVALRPFSGPDLQLTVPAEMPAAYMLGTAPAQTQPQPRTAEVAEPGATVVTAEKQPVRRPVPGVVIGATAAVILAVAVVGWLWSQGQVPFLGVPTALPTTIGIARPIVQPPASWQIIALALRQLNGIAVDEPGNIYVANSDSNRVQKLSAIGQLLFEWGNDWGPDPGQFESPQDVAVDALGNIYVADQENHRIQKLSATGAALAQWGTRGTGPGQFDALTALALDTQGNVYVSDTGNDRIQKLSAAGLPLAQWGTAGRGPGQFGSPMGIAVDGRGNVYVADHDNDRIQKLSATGQPIAQWGTSGRGAGQFSSPTGVAVDGQGNVYVTDRGNARVQKLSASGQPLAEWGTFGSGNGPGQFSNPFGIAVDTHGSVYVVDRDNQRIQKLPNGK